MDLKHVTVRASGCSSTHAAARIGELAVEAALQAIETGEHRSLPTAPQPLRIRSSTAPLRSGQPVRQTASTPS